MPNTFEILTGFLDRYEADVEGRELREPPDEIRVQLRALARGDLARTEQDDLMAILGQHPDWIARLADEVKALRGAPEAAPRPRV